MSIALTFNGQNYIIPTTNEVGWGSNLDDYLVAIAAGALQKTGGNFTLAADVDFGGAFGLKAQYFKSRSVNPALTGILRLANGDLISWRDSTNTSDLSLTVNSLNQLVYNGTPLQQVSLVSAHILVGNASNIATDVAMTGDVSITNAGLTSVNNVQPLVITDAMINTSAAIAVSKLAALPINQVVLTDASGFLTGAGVVAPTVGQVLTYNGATWINSPPTNTSAGSGVVFFLVDTATSAGQFLLSQSPELVEQTDSVAVTAATSPIIIESYRTSGLERTQLDAGVWTLDLWRGVTAGGTGGVQTIEIEYLRRFAGAGTITITGAGATRTCTVTAGTPFLLADANANITLAGQVETPTGVFPITAFTSSSVVTLTTGAGYVNETTVAYFVQRQLFNLTTGEINDTAITQQTIDSVQPAFTGFSTADELAVRLYATTDSAASRTVAYTHGGSTRSSHMHTPLVTLHNSLAGLQGGTSNQYYHMTSTQNSVLDATSSIQTQLNNTVKLTGNQSIAGQKTFTDDPILNNGLSGSLLSILCSFSGGDPSLIITNNSSKSLQLKTYGSGSFATINGRSANNASQINASTAANLFISLATSAVFSLGINNVEKLLIDGSASRITSQYPLTITATTNQLDLGTGNFTRITAPAPTSSRIYTIPDAGSDASFVLSKSDQTISGIKTFSTAGTAIAGITNGSDATSGYIGQYIESIITTLTNVPTSAQYGDLTSISLPAGDWDVNLVIKFSINGATWSKCFAGIGLDPGDDNTGITVTNSGEEAWASTSTAVTVTTITIPPYRLNLTATTTVYAKMYALYSVGTPQVKGGISARRVR